MDQPWFRKLLYGPRKLPAESTQTKAEHGDAEAQFGLGLRFTNGEGTARDCRQAAQWYFRAANQNHALAQFSLGMMLADGRGVPRDDVEGMLWIRRAAQQGYAGAQYNLGLRCRRASFERMPQDALESNLEACKWFRLAAAQGYKGSNIEFERIALGMTREQVTEGNQRAASFIAACAQAVPA